MSQLASDESTCSTETGRKQLMAAASAHWLRSDGQRERVDLQASTCCLCHVADNDFGFGAEGMSERLHLRPETTCRQLMAETLVLWLQAAR